MAVGIDFLDDICQLLGTLMPLNVHKKPRLAFSICVRLMLICAFFVLRIGDLNCYAGEIAYSAQKFNLTSNGDIRPASPYHHLYLVKLPFGKPERITHGNFDDTSPAFSPNGHQMAFLRTFPNGSSSIYVCSLRSLRSRLLCTWGCGESPSCNWSPDRQWLSVGNDPTCEWSPNGHWLSVGYQLWGGENGTYGKIVSLAGKSISFDWGSCLAWSPNSRYVFIGNMGGNADIYDDRTGQLDEQTTNAYVGSWLNNSVVLCSPFDSSAYKGQAVATLNRETKVVAVLTLHFDSGKSNPWPNFKEDTLTLKRIPGCRTAYIATVHEHSTDGDHAMCYVMTRLRAPAKYLGELNFAAPAPNAPLFAATTCQWVGPYKKGGARLGKLFVFAYPGNKKQEITHGWWDFRGLDWR
jgi:hypothetical protein